MRELTNDEVMRVITELVVEFAWLRGVNVDELHAPVTVLGRRRASLWTRSAYVVGVQVVPLFGSGNDDRVEVTLRRVTEPVNNDGSLVTSRSVAVDQTGDQLSDQTIEEK